MTTTPNYGLYMPNRTDNLPVDSTLSNNFLSIDNILRSHKDQSNELDTKLSNIVANSGTSDTEVVVARGGFTTLDDRLKRNDDYYKVVKASGNETTDDTTAIQDAIISDALYGRWTVIPKGNYKLTAPLILYPNTKLIMHKETKLVRYHNDSMFQNGQTGDLSGASNISVIGGKLELRGHILNGTNQDGSGFALGYAVNVYIADVEIYNVYYSHGMEICAIENATVERCGFYGFKLDTGGTRINAEAIQIERGTGAGFPYFGTPLNQICKNIKVRDCKFGASNELPSWNLAVGSHAGDVIIACDGLEISGCVSISPLLTKIAQFKGYKNVTFERNVLTAPHGLEVYDDGTISKINLRNNKLVATTHEAVYLSGVDGLNSDGNTYNGNTNAIALVNSCKNIKIKSADDLYAQTSDTFNAQATSSYFIVDGATVRKSGRHAFNVFGGCSHFKILNCMVLDVGDTGVAFNMAGSGTKVGEIRGNHITDATLVNVVAATSGMDRLYFNQNFYPASITTPINSTATNSDTTGNRTF